jgi:hypothetical protein
VGKYNPFLFSLTTRKKHIYLAMFHLLMNRSGDWKNYYCVFAIFEMSLMFSSSVLKSLNLKAISDVCLAAYYCECNFQAKQDSRNILGNLLQHIIRKMPGNTKLITTAHRRLRSEQNRFCHSSWSS